MVFMGRPFLARVLVLDQGVERIVSRVFSNL